MIFCPHTLKMFPNKLVRGGILQPGLAVSGPGPWPQSRERCAWELMASVEALLVVHAMSRSHSKEPELHRNVL